MEKIVNVWFNYLSLEKRKEIIRAFAKAGIEDPSELPFIEQDENVLKIIKDSMTTVQFAKLKQHIKDMKSILTLEEDFAQLVLNRISTDREFKLQEMQLLASFGQSPEFQINYKSLQEGWNKRAEIEEMRTVHAIELIREKKNQLFNAEPKPSSSSKTALYVGGTVATISAAGALGISAPVWLPAAAVSAAAYGCAVTFGFGAGTAVVAGIIRTQETRNRVQNPSQIE